MSTPLTAVDHLATIGTTAQQLVHVAAQPYDLAQERQVAELISQLTLRIRAIVCLRNAGPPPAHPRPWHQVLGLDATATRPQVVDAYWKLGTSSDIPMPELNLAYQQALAATAPTPTKEQLADAFNQHYDARLQAADISTIMSHGLCEVDFLVDLNWYGVKLTADGTPDPATLEQLPF